jgi:cephalosporin hydroxylase
MEKINILITLADGRLIIQLLQDIVAMQEIIWEVRQI